MLTLQISQSQITKHNKRLQHKFCHVCLTGPHTQLHPSLNFIDTLFLSIIFELPLHTTQIQPLPTIFEMSIGSTILNYPEE
jgi:hypothetical protein